ncbi:NAD(P)H quinone oxidoreductase [Agaricicola taiwanensis]|uniref:NAD(P)H quinone oxidoreductase n=1 Tax=Agaricicola taiwanensis TaxID=591372 RepID=A0A8J3DWD4_9RHOB|nr:NAD(P)H-quinone oxidoreductase [Agaricicola taiwanensis]GGE46167.1 NAD(P)H quinone oxidoreductase [Agaricicola taiwanensis]
MQDVIDIDGSGPDGALVLRQAPVPEPGPGEVLIAIHAAGVNRADIKQRQGRYLMPPGAPSIPGLEAAGEVAACGPGVSRWRPGDRVCALLLGGGYAQHCAVPEAQCLPVPKGLSMVEAASLPEAAFTSWLALIEQSSMQPGETVLIHGGAGGVGSFALQLATAFGARAIASGGSEEKRHLIADLGAVLALNYRITDVVKAVKDFTGGRGVDVILNQVGTNYLAADMEMLTDKGRLCMISHDHGRQAQFDYFDVMYKRLVLTGARLRQRTTAEKAHIALQLERRVWPLLETGRIRPLVTQTYPLAEAAEAHRFLESGDAAGKIVLTVQ